MTPGTYWIQRESSSKAIMVDVSEINGALMVWWPNYDQSSRSSKGGGMALSDPHRDDEAGST